MNRAARLRPLLLPVLAFASLSGCISFGAKPPPTLLTLSPAASPPIGAATSSATAPTITILVPVVPAALATARVPVQTGDTSIAYVKDAVWSEVPARMFARLLSDTIGATTGRIVLSNAQSFTDPGARLTGELRSFGIDAATNQAVVTFDATLMRSDAKVFEKRRFEAREPVAKIDATSVGPAINTAANKVAADVAAWVGK